MPTSKGILSDPKLEVGNEAEAEEEDPDNDEEVEDSEDEVEDLEDAEMTMAAAAAWLKGPLKGQKRLRDAARPEGLQNLGLKCPGSERIVNGLVPGTEVCPDNTTVSFETGVFYRDRQRDHIGLKCRCSHCDARFNFKEFLRVNFLEAGANQETCSHGVCVGSLWEASRFCEKHFLLWKPELLIIGRAALEGLRELVSKAASSQWRPTTKLGAKIIEKSDSEADIPASEVVNIDLEYSSSSHEVFQIGLANLKKEKILDCLTRYSEGIIMSSSSRCVPETWPLKQHKEKVKRYFTQDGTLGAKEVVGKLRKAGISEDTIFLSWSKTYVDLSYFREWLEQENFHDILPGDESVCLLLKEFRDNLDRELGTTCFQGKAFPLSLPVVFMVIFEDDPLVGRNHHALVDAQQLAMMARLFIDLCKPPKEADLLDGIRSEDAGLEETATIGRVHALDEYQQESKALRFRGLSCTFLDWMFRFHRCGRKTELLIVKIGEHTEIAFAAHNAINKGLEHMGLDEAIHDYYGVDINVNG
ncbi:unnamed protein product [Penicillium glandicola]